MEPSPLSAALVLDDVRFGFADRPDFLGPVSLSAKSGRFWSIVGPNGAGKSTLLRVMIGLMPPGGGQVRLDGQPLGRLSPMLRARCIALVPQNPPHVPRDMTVGQFVRMGRYPHRSLGVFDSADDFAAAEQAMHMATVARFSDRPLTTLSGGEFQRVQIAAALAQQPAVLLLDEPTASLDLQHQLAIFDLLRRMATECGLAIVAVTHDVNLAARFSTHALILHEGRAVAAGPTHEVLTVERLQKVYGVPLQEVSLPGTSAAGSRWIVPALEATDSATPVPTEGGAS